MPVGSEHAITASIGYTLSASWTDSYRLVPWPPDHVPWSEQACSYGVRKGRHSTCSRLNADMSVYGWRMVRLQLISLPAVLKTICTFDSPREKD